MEIEKGYSILYGCKDLHEGEKTRGIIISEGDQTQTTRLPAFALLITFVRQSKAYIRAHLTER